LIAGDINTHADEWDPLFGDNDIGSNIMDFMDENGFVLANDTKPIYHSHLGCRTVGGKEGETAPDVTFFHSDYSLRSTNGNTNILLGNATMIQSTTRSTLETASTLSETKLGAHQLAGAK